jgi:hypothetical protein
VITQIAGQRVDTFQKGVTFVYLARSYFFGKSRVELAGTNQGNISNSHLLSSDFVYFESVNALTVVVDELDDILEEGVETVTLEVQTDEIAGVVAVCHQELFYIQYYLPMLLFCICLFNNKPNNFNHCLHNITTDIQTTIVLPF